MTDAHRFQSRLDAVAERLRRGALLDLPPRALTAPDPSTGERWEGGQVWAHLAEFVPYWIGEATTVIERRGTEPVPFGRTKSDPGRVAAIERDRRTDRGALWSRLATDIATLRTFLADLGDDEWTARGRHPTLGVMTLVAVVDEFLVGHLEQHAEQLDELRAAGAAVT